jgi:pyridoxal phosphate enzyme (YggS family)
VIAERVAAVRDRIARAAARAKRRPEDILLVAVSKTFPHPAVREAHAAGLVDFGENRVQEAEEKIAALADLRSAIRWHLVGHLQGNKARKAAALFDRIHSIDGEELGRRLDRVAAETGSVCHAYVEVDLAGEVTKQGVPAAELMATLEVLRGLSTLRIEGLMALPPFFDDAELARPYFVRLRTLRDEAVARGLLHGHELSMGMSHDLEIAVEEGATLVRVGTAIFGERPVRA